MSAIWVLCEDYGCQGLAAPFQAFDDKRDAEAVLAIMSAPLAAPTVRLIEVPMWPDYRKEPTP